MDDNPQQTPIETPTATQAAGPDPVTPPMGAPMASYPRPGMGGMVSQDDKSQAMLMWILTIFFGFIPPLIFFFVAKDKPFTFRQSALALTLELLVIVAYIVCFILAIVTLGIGGLLYPLIWVLNLVLCIMGAVAANKGEDYSPPLVTGVTKSLFKV